MPLAASVSALRGTHTLAAALRRSPLTILVGELCQGRGEALVEHLGAGANLISYESPVEYHYGAPQAVATLDAACTGHVLYVGTTQWAAFEAFQRLRSADASEKLSPRGR